ncbi:hypothetical protein OGW02_11140 [Citrobacter sp. Ce105]|uniref:hypothetical protein n=1 Tax=Citrobacter sp. Ce105 TaxID=2985041 RepID=UPI0025782C63|nr:hypothetical protein [Citrobacter sp. Ce105]MDM3290192.1 hypothetical protein [Citrobacter sp. Ce105]
MTSREQFEKWFQQKYKVTADTMKVMQIKVELAWESWQASRAAVEVEVNRLNIEIENLECAHICLDDVGVPRKEGDETLSLWGRIVSYKSSTEGRCHD